MNLEVYVCPYYLKKRVLSLIDKTKPYKIITREELESSLLFSYGNDSIYYVYNTYASYNFSLAQNLIDSAISLRPNLLNYSDKKIIELVNIRESLYNRHLIFKNELLYKIIKHSTIHLYGEDNSKNLIRALKDNSLTFIIEDYKKVFVNKPSITLYENTRLEIGETLNKVCSLIDQGVNYTDIAIIIPPSKISAYISLGALFNLKFKHDSINVRNYPFVAKFLETSERNKSFDLSELEFDNNEFLNHIKSQIKIVFNENFSNYSFDFQLSLLKSVLSTYIEGEGIALSTNIDDIWKYKYVFITNFDNSYPSIQKDNDYLCDKLKEEYTYVEKTDDINRNNIIKLMMNIYSHNNVYISRAEVDSTSGKLFESLITKSEIYKDDMFMEEVKYDYHEVKRYSDQFDKLYLKISDELYKKYGEMNNYYSYLLSLSNLSTTPYQIQNKNLRYALNMKNKTSFSSLSTYSVCPFSYLIKYIYKIKDNDNLFNINSGIIGHKVLEYLMKDEVLSYDDVLSECKIDCQALSIRDNFYLKKRYETAVKVMTRLREIAHETTLSTFEEEIPFTYTLNKSNKLIEGKIDAIYMGGANYIVVDYKSSDKKIDLDEVVNCFNFQLPLYSFVLEQERMKDKKLLGMYYFNLDPNTIFDYKYEKEKMSGLTIDANELKKASLSGKPTNNFTSSKIEKKMSIDDMKKAMFSKIDELIDELSSGIFDVTSKKLCSDDKVIADKCQYCTYKDICFKTKSDEVYIQKIKDLTEEEEENNGF